MKRKITALFLIFAMCLTLLAGCGGDNSGGGGDQKVEKIKIYLPTSGKYDDMDKVMEAVKAGKPEMTPFVSNNGSTAPTFQYGTWDDLGSNYGILMDGGKTSEVVNLFATDEYRHLCEVLHDWNVKGYSSNVLTQNDAAFCTLDQTDFNTSFYQATTCNKPIDIVMFGEPVARTYNNVTYTMIGN